MYRMRCDFFHLSRSSTLSTDRLATCTSGPYAAPSTPRQCGHLLESCEYGGEPDEAEVVGGFLLVPGRHSAKMLDPAEEPLDHVAMTITLAVEGWGRSPHGIRRNASPPTRFNHQGADRVAVIGGIGHDVASLKPFQQRPGPRRISRLARREDDPHSTAGAVDRGMHFRGQSAAGTAETAPAVGFLFFSDGPRREPLAD